MKDTKRQELKQINNWYLAFADDCRDPYTAPEMRPLALVGDVNGRRGKTSPIEHVSIKTCTVKTWSGSIYKLGDPDPKWIAWIRDNNHPIGDSAISQILRAKCTWAGMRRS